MPDETRPPDPEFRWFVEYADGWHRAVETICTIVGVSPALSADESVVAVRERVEAIRQETARATWERAAQIAEQFAEENARWARVTPEMDSARREAEAIAGTLRRQAATPLEDQQ